TADGREAEIAIPPIVVRPGCTHAAEHATVVGRELLRDAIPAPMRLAGYSTHLNVEIDDDVVVRTGQLFVSRLAAPMMLMLDRPTSPGLVVRPRRGRLELGGEYCTGDALRAATTFAVAAGLHCAQAASSRRTQRRLPHRVRARVVPAAMRTGWYI